MKKQLRGSLYLLLATVIWGSTFVAQSVGMDYIGPFTFQAVRCGLAVIGLLPLIFIMDKKAGRSFRKEWANKQLWVGGLLCALPLFLAVNLQQVASFPPAQVNPHSSRQCTSSLCRSWVCLLDASSPLWFPSAWYWR